MKNQKRVLSLLMSLAIMLTLTIPALAATEDAGYSDVAANAWYADAVDYVRDNGLMSGTGGSAFSPDTAMTRAMLVTVLYRAAGSPAVTGASTFADVAPSAYYSDAVAWAVENGIVSGYGNGNFGSDDPVTREQIATILWRYDGEKAATTSAAFTDTATIGGYAVESVNWAAENGIVAGQSDGNFNPKGNATRAQVAVMLYRYRTLGAQVPDEPTQPSGPDGRTLIAYFSRAGENYGVGVVEKGNTQHIAEFIAEETGGELFKIETVTPYPVSYDETTAIARREQQENARPALSAHMEDMEQYDTIFVGYPIWYGTMPQAMFTFLEEYDFSGKTIIPFSTHAGSGFGSSISDITSLCPDSTLLNGFSVAGTQATNSRSNVQTWLAGLDLPEENNHDGNAATAITMTVGDTVITAQLSDSQTTRDFLALLPITVSLNRYGDREYYGDPGGALSTEGEAIPDFENGDVTYYPPSGNLAIFFGNEDSSNQSDLIRMGRITSDLDVFNTLGQSVEMRIELMPQD